MPLFTDDIGAARIAYDALEKRALSAELRASRLAEALAAVSSHKVDLPLLRQRIAGLEEQTIALNNQLNELKQSRVDAGLQQFIEAMGMAAALGEASMPGRIIESLSASINAYMTPNEGGVALRFHSPELGAVNAGAIGKASFSIAKVPPAAGAAAPGNFHALLLETQAIYARFMTNAPNAGDLAQRIVVAVTQAIADTGSWSFPYLVAVAANLADLQLQLAAHDRRPQAIQLSARCQVMAVLAKSLAAKSSPVAGDLFALTAAFGETTIAAGAFAGLFAP